MAEQYKITLLNEKNERFEKSFENPIQYRKFYNKAKRSKKLEITSHDDLPN